MECPEGGLNVEAVQNAEFITGHVKVQCGEKVVHPACFPFCGEKADVSAPALTKQKDEFFKPCFPFCPAAPITSSEQNINSQQPAFSTPSWSPTFSYYNPFFHRPPVYTYFPWFYNIQHPNHFSNNPTYWLGK